MKQVTRTFTETTIFGAKVYSEEGQVKTFNLAPVTVFNVSVDTIKAVKLLQKEYGKQDQYVITKIDTVEKTYGLDLDKFLELATEIK